VSDAASVRHNRRQRIKAAAGTTLPAAECGTVLGERRGGTLRANSIEDSSSGLLDVLQALGQ